MKKKYLIIVLAVLGCAGLMGLAAPVKIGLKDMFNPAGRIKYLWWDTGQKDTRASLLAAAGGGDVSYPIDISGTETTGILPESKGGFGTSTPGYVRTQTATDITMAGTGTDTSTMRTNGVDISPTEKSYSDGLTGNIQTQINSKVGTQSFSTITGSVTASQLPSDGIVAQNNGSSTNQTLTNAILQGTNTTFPTNETTTGTKTITLAADSDFQIMTNGGKFRVSGDIVGSSTPRMLFKISSPVVLGTTTTAATMVGSWTIPAGTMDIDSGIQFYLGGTNTANSSGLFRIDVGSQTIFNNGMTTNVFLKEIPYFQNTGSTSTNVYGPNFQSFLSPSQRIFSSTVNTAVDLEVSVWLAGTGTTVLSWFRAVLEP